MKIEARLLCDGVREKGPRNVKPGSEMISRQTESLNLNMEMDGERKEAKIQRVSLREEKEPVYGLTNVGDAATSMRAERMEQEECRKREGIKNDIMWVRQRICTHFSESAIMLFSISRRTSMSPPSSLSRAYRRPCALIASCAAFVLGEEEAMNCFG